MDSLHLSVDPKTLSSILLEKLLIYLLYASQEKSHISFWNTPVNLDFPVDRTLQPIPNRVKIYQKPGDDIYMQVKQL